MAVVVVVGSGLGGCEDDADDEAQVRMRIRIRMRTWSRFSSAWPPQLRLRRKGSRLGIDCCVQVLFLQRF